MRVPKHIENEIREELDLRPDRHGKVYLSEYDKAVAAWDANMNNEQNFNQRLMANVENAGQRLRAWYDVLLKSRTERVKRKREN
jgi:hypothetical protein